jgi:predicted DNA-binding transcriptional regulator AlpA
MPPLCQLKRVSQRQMSAAQKSPEARALMIYPSAMVGASFRLVPIDASIGTATVDAVSSPVVDVEVLGVTEVTALLGMSRQRVDQLSHRDSEFPEPVTTLGRGRLWEKAAIEKWAQETGRTVVGEGVVDQEGESPQEWYKRARLTCCSRQPPSFIPRRSITRRQRRSTVSVGAAVRPSES